MARHRLSLLAAGLLFAACAAPGNPSSTSSTTSVSIATASSAAATSVATPSSQAPEYEPMDVTVMDLPGAVSVNVATNGTRAVVGWIEPEAVVIAELEDDGRVGDPVLMHEDRPPFAHPIERPAIGIDGVGVVHVAYTILAGEGGSVVYRTWDGVERGGPGVISGVPRPETVLVHILLEDDRPTFAWLEDSTLSVAVETGGSLVERELVDDLTCDCCNPVPFRVGGALAVAYRDQVRDGEVVRDVRVVRSEDGGETFGEPVLVPDDHWFIDACPFTGPSVVAWDDEVVIGWMDARQTIHPDQRTTSIWIDRSADGGRTFGADVRLTDGGIHRWPMLARDHNGVIHIVWETQGQEGGISYSRSEDDGRTFHPPRILFASGEAGAVTAPSLVVHGDELLVSWTDREGGHFALIGIDQLGS